MNQYYLSFLILTLGLSQVEYLHGQDVSKYQTIIREIEKLESNKDPKCHATASRLEDFLYGTPLSFEARNKRITFQQAYVKTVWLEFTKALKKQSGNANELALFQEVEQRPEICPNSVENKSLRERETLLPAARKSLRPCNTKEGLNSGRFLG